MHQSCVTTVRGGGKANWCGKEWEDEREGRLSPSASASLPPIVPSACHLCSSHLRRLRRSAGRDSKILFIYWFTTQRELQGSVWTNFVASKPTYENYVGLYHRLLHLWDNQVSGGQELAGRHHQPICATPHHRVLCRVSIKSHPDHVHLCLIYSLLESCILEHDDFKGVCKYGHCVYYSNWMGEF